MDDSIPSISDANLISSHLGEMGSGAPGFDDNCFVWTVHDSVFAMILADEAAHHTIARVLTPYGMLAASAVLCFVGFYAMRIVAATAAFAAGALGVIRLSYISEAEFSCDGITIAIAVCGGICALMAGLLMRTLSLLIGASAVCGVVGIVFVTCGDVCGADLWLGAPRLFDLPLLQFWGAMLLAAAVGALVARRRYREMLATVAAIFGGFGAAVSVRILVHNADAALPSYGFLMVMAGATGGGLLTQYYLQKRLADRKKKKNAPARSAQGRPRRAKKDVVLRVSDANDIESADED
jgi:hypothetical protein